MPASRLLSQLRRRLERAELVLLRQVVAEQAERIEALETVLARTRLEADRNSDTAEYWRESFMDLQEQLLDDDPDATLGLTQAGEVMLIPSTSSAH